MKWYNNHSRISYWGDSFFWGQSLDYYDFGLSECNPNLTDNPNISGCGHVDGHYEHTAQYHRTPYQPPNHNGWGDYLKGMERKFWHVHGTGHHFEDSQDYNRKHSIIGRRATTQVSKHFGMDWLMNYTNGGCVCNCINGLLTTRFHPERHSDVMIFLLPPLTRCVDDGHFIREGRRSRGLHLDKCRNWENSSEAYMSPQQEQDVLEGKSTLQNFPYDEYHQIFRFIIDYIERNVQEYRKLEENKFLQYYYIGGWDFMFRYCWKRQMENQRDSEVWKTYREHLIPIHHRGVSYDTLHEAMYEIPNVGIDDEFPINDTHPNQKMHNIIAKSIVKRLEQDKVE